MRLSQGELFPARALEDFRQLVTALDRADGEHLRTFAVHGIQHFIRLNAQLHEAWGKLAYDELGKVLFAPHFNVPLHQ